MSGSLDALVICVWDGSGNCFGPLSRIFLHSLQGEEDARLSFSGSIACNHYN